jgi:hypothetical protein
LAATRFGVADKFAAVVDCLPRSLTSPLLELLQIFLTAAKKEFAVKLKHSLSFPPELLSKVAIVLHT